MASNKASSSLDSAKPAEFHPKIKPAASRGSGGDGTFLGHILCEILVPNARSPLVLDRDIRCEFGLLPTSAGRAHGARLIPSPCACCMSLSCHFESLRWILLLLH